MIVDLEDPVISSSTFQLKSFYKPMQYRYVSLVIACSIMLSAGTLSVISIYSPHFSQVFKFNLSEINTIGSIGNTALYLSFLVVGPFFDRCGLKATIGAAVLFVSGGYLMVWLTLQQLVAASVHSFSFYFAMIGLGSTCSYMAIVAFIPQLFSKERNGLIIGILMLFYGLSGTIYSQVP